MHSIHFPQISKRLLRLVPVALFAIFGFPAPAEAHVRWFVDTNMDCPFCHFEKDLTSGLVIAGAVLFVLLAVALQRAPWTRRFCAWCASLYQMAPGTEWRLVSFLAGLMLVANSTMRVFLAPNLELPGPAVTATGMVAQFILGLLLLSQVTFSIAGLAIIAVSIVSAFLIPWQSMLNYAFEFIGLGLALFFAGPILSPVDRRVFRSLGLEPARFQHLPVPIIRIALGITLVILAIDEKLLHPHLTVAFLQQYHFNFMPLLGFDGFKDIHFALAAGVAEMVFGLLLAAGIATRFVTATVSVFFIATLFALGPIELVGHAPLFGIAFLLISRGSGAYCLLPASSVPRRTLFKVRPPEAAWGVENFQ